ncbi:hypothetical protein MELE44368_19790 [Mycolicibacterium elephantis DSM 44368]|uniref:Uncharacterized protein n=1 Tax=Mycolicibacterium elephantis DSM 44368 TaxID=1335622 RepID=A0A439DTU4_9MYCO|nr:hypothetical protein MELE44368_19790 [Mycolicibacterium elephantis DSM 44368]
MVPDAAYPAIVGDDAAAVGMDEAENELFGCLVDECLLPGREFDRPLMLFARTV